MKKHCIAFIPARSGSQRIPNKNIKLLAGSPLISYTIAIANQSDLFSRIIVSTNSEEIAKIALFYGAEVPFLRPIEFASDNSPDIDWLRYTIQKLKIDTENTPYFSILRPTSPFRSVSMIQKAWKIISADKNADSIRAVEKCSQHPAKMWRVSGTRMRPVMESPDKNSVEWFSLPTQSLPPVFVQNASLEIAKTEIPLQTNSIAGSRIIPFITTGYEGYDLNTEKDWVYAEYLVRKKKVNLPDI